MEFFITNMFNRSLTLYYCGYDQVEPNHSWGPSMRDTYLLHYIKTGEGTYRIKDREYKVNAGESFILFPGESSYYCADPINPWEYYWVAFDGDLVEECLKLSNLSPDAPIHRHIHVTELEQIFNQLFEQARQNTTHSEISSIGWMHQILALISKESHLNRIKATVKESNPKEYYVNKAISYIKANYSMHNLPVEDIAKYLNLDRSYFTKIFTQILNQSPHQFILDYRIEKASRLLTHTNLSIKSIANAVGFEDIIYFTKVFKKHRGYSPSTFRKGELNLK
jgi:AraC-like DNA-binding protein